VPKTTPPSLSGDQDKYLPFLIEIKKRLLFVVLVFSIAAVLGFIYYEKIVILILKLFNIPGINIVFTSPFQFLNLAINSAFLIGTVVVFPIFLFQILAFLKPGLNSREYKTLSSLIPLSFFLFLAGFTLGIFVMKYVVSIFYEKSQNLNIGNFLDISLLLSQTLVTAAFMGIAFQFPTAATALIRLKVIEYKSLANQRMIAYAISIIFAAFLPPTDLLSLLLLTLPLAMLFELTLILNKFLFKPHPSQ